MEMYNKGERMTPEEAAKLDLGDLIVYQEKTQYPELGLVVGKTEKAIDIDWFQEKNPYVGTYRFYGGYYFWGSVEKVS
jgi:hypothetical protein